MSTCSHNVVVPAGVAVTAGKISNAWVNRARRETRVTRARGNDERDRQWISRFASAAQDIPAASIALILFPEFPHVHAALRFDD